MTIRTRLWRFVKSRLKHDDDDADIDLMDGEEEWNTMAAQPKEEGMYSDEDVADDAEPSLEDVAGA